MDSYGLTESEKRYNLHEYNHALFENMKAFMDSCWEVNLSTNTVVILHETLKPEYVGKEFEYNNILCEYGEHYVYPLDRKNWYQLLSVSTLNTLKEETVVDIHIIGSTSIPEICRLILTPAFDSDGKINRVYLSSKNIESDIKVLREMQEEKQIIFAAMGVTYPIIIYSNLTKNSYMLYMLKDYKLEIPMSGTYESLINIISESILPVYRDDYLFIYSRENLENQLTDDSQYVEIEYEQNIDGTIHWISSKTVRINNPYNSDFMAITLISIIDKQHRIEYATKMALQDAYRTALDAEKAKSEFLSRMSHEMLTPLNTVQGLVTLGLNDENITPDLKKIIEKIGRSAEQLNEQISRLLDTSLLETETVTLSEESSDLTILLSKVTEQIKESAIKKNITLEVSADEIKHNSVICDPTRIMQIFNALLSNSVKFTENGGNISAVLEEGKGRRTGFGYYKFTVKDNGIGIKEEFIDKIYEPFEQAADNRKGSNAGSGLGLYIVRNMTNLMGGNITVNSVYGEGSEFTATFFLKLPDAANKTENKPDFKHTVDFTGKRILVVEDNEINNEIISEILREMGFDVDSAYDGKEAVNIIFDSKPDKYDAVLMDIMMPILDGYEATRTIRASDRSDLKEIPIIAASANSYPSDIELSLKSGMNDHIAKPIENISLAKILAQWLK
ncbi:MAG: ATP-binding protein [Clostridium sp.]|nr:ATP-binding protein [Clostridium sp.]MCM1547751.1 ATP-binding protein [Ruminococcus sp.]